MNESEMIEQLNKALEQAMEVQDKYSAALDEMASENKFLTDTILQNKMGLITEERRKLLAEVNQANASSQNAIREAQKLKSEYERKLSKITLNAQYEKKQFELKEDYRKKETYYKDKISLFKHIMIAAIVGLIIATISALTGIKGLLLLIIMDVVALFLFEFFCVFDWRGKEGKIKKMNKTIL